MKLFQYLCADMYIEKLIIRDFKNIASAELRFSEKMNCICGDNGEGKTNLLDAVWYLSMARSFLLPNDRFVCREGASAAILHGAYIAEGGNEEHISLSVTGRGEKVLKRNGKAYPRISEHIGLLPVVVISPADSSLINESGEERRRFLNLMLSQTDRQYLRSLQKYNRALMQRNKVLKQMGENARSGAGNAGLDMLLETLSAQMGTEAAYIYEKRKMTCERLSSLSSEFYRTISGGHECVSMRYVSDLEKGALCSLLEDARERDRVLQYTSVGVQRDDVVFVMDGRPMKQCASQGQQKSFLISLKMAQYFLVREVFGCPPLLLLDDIFDKLDIKRVEYLINLVSSSDFGQIFITDSNKVRLEGIVRRITPEGRFFTVTGGAFSEQQGGETV